jgi:hypothetical protein
MARKMDVTEWHEKKGLKPTAQTIMDYNDYLTEWEE